MKALILVADNVEDLEFFYLYYRPREEGLDVYVAGPEGGRIVGRHGCDFTCHLSFSEANAGDYDLLVLPGGKAPEVVVDGNLIASRSSEDLPAFCREMLAAVRQVVS